MSEAQRGAIRYASLLAALTTYLFSFQLPWGYFYFDNRKNPITGLSAIEDLWKCFPFCPAILGHVAFCVAVPLVLLGRSRGGFWIACVGLLCATNISALQARAQAVPGYGGRPDLVSVPVPGPQGIVWNINLPGGGVHRSGWDGVGIGYGLWVGSLILAVLAGMIGPSVRKEDKRGFDYH